MKKARGGRAFASAAKGTTDTRDESRAGGSFTIVGIGASAGGLEAFSALLKHLPLDTGMGFVLVQHLDPEHDSALAQLLGRATSLPVHEVTNNLHVEPNHVYVIPPNTNLGIASGVLTLLPRPKTRTPHRSIDFFLEALAEDQRDRAIGVILSGTATDGTLGLEAIKAEGGITFAQDDSARYDSMPRSAVAAGCVDFVMSPEDIAHEIARIAKHPAVARVASGSSTRAEDDRTAATTHEDDATPLPSGGRGTPATGAEQARAEADHGGMERIGARAENGFKTILLLLRNHSGVDFSLYKSTTIQRRITRRMVLSKQNTHDDYAQFLRGNAKELDALYSDVLISVTSFFRTPEAFDVLQRTVFPRLLQQRTDDPLRVWVLGCSTGQEAYSIAMAFVEAADKAPRMCKLQVFATDLNDVLLDKARHGLYAKTLAQDLSTERLRRFFVEEEGGYRVNKSLREMVVFARQNVIADPPFSRMDVISCRNLLIYFDAGLQKKIFPVFHYALKPGGFLYLGASESIGGFTDLFEPVDKKHKIYAKKAAPTPAFHLPARNDGERPARGSRQARRPLRMPLTPGGGTDAVRGELSVQREADRVTVHQFAPPAVLINAELQVLQFRGPTGAYLEPPSGKASFDLLKMARNGLMLPLRTAINKAKKDDRTVRKEHVRIEQDGRTRTVNVEVIPLKNLRERCFLIVFEDAGRAGPLAATARRKRRAAEPPAAHANRAAGPSESRRSAALEAELAETRDYLQSVQEQHEAANEELQASNEEVQSANEELQSINEELETSKEELESANEELNTVNDEMASRNAELNRLYSDLVNVQTSTQQAIVLLSRNLTIRRFSAQAEKQFNLLAADVGRPFSSVRHNLDVSDLDRCITEVIDSVRADEREVQDKDGRWFSLRVRPYLTLDNTVDGAVLVLVDISDLKRKELSIAVARDYAQAIIRTARDPLLILHADLRVDTANQAFYDTFKVSSTDAEGRLVYELGNHQWDIPGLRELLENILPRDRVFDQFEVTHDFETIGRRTMLLNARRLSGGADTPDKILLGIQDVTDQRENVSLVRQSHARYQALVDTSAQIVWTTDALGCVVEDSPSWRAFTGQTYEQWQRTGWLDALHPDDRQRVHELWQRAVAEHTPVDTEYRLRHVNGDWRWAHVRAVPVLRPDGTVREWVGMNSDITERKQAEEKLRDSEQRFAKFMHHLPGLAWIKDSDGRYVYANDAAQDAFRTRRMELYGKSDEEVFPPETAAQFRSNDRQALESESSVQTVETLEHADGILHHSIVNKFAIPGPGGRAALVGGVAIDITELKEAEEALRQSEERYRTLFDLGPVAVYSCDREGVIQNFNRRAAELWGREPAPGDTDPRFCGSFKMFRPDGSFMPHEQCPMAEVVAGTVSEVRDGEVHIERPDGTRITVVVNIRPLKNQRGEVTGAINCFYDITARKEAEEGRARLSAIVESSDDAIVSKDLNGVITSWNAGAERLYGYTAQDVVGQPVSLLIPPDRLNEEPTVLARIRRGEVVEPFETVRRRKDGTLVDVSLTVSPILNSQGQVVGASKIARDITERKKAAETLLEADRHKNEFLAMLAHELRNPLAPILVSIEILRRAKKLEGVERLELSPGVDHALDVLQRQVGQMVRLVDDLLDAGRISRGKIDLRRERVEVASVVRHAVEAARPIAERRGQELTIALPTVPMYVNADPTRMAQIVGNLLNNACKFTEPGGHIWLTVERVEESRPDQTEAASNGLAPQIVISVRDTGVGIAPDRLEGIFDMFTQLDTSLERSLTGLGIGLALVRTLVEMHGGTVRASSPGIGQGSEFVVRLPIVTEAAIQVPLSPTTEPAVTPLRILIVDDNHDSADMLATLLKFSGHETHTAHDGMAAVEAAIKLDPDVILLDIGLPQLNGYEAAHRIREQNSGRGRPVLVALTGWGQDEDRRRSEEAGFDAHVVKPVDHASLHKLLAELGSRNQTVEP